MKRIVLCGLALTALAGVPARAAEDGGVGAVVDAAETVLVNGRPRPDLMITTENQGGWSFRYERDLRADPAAWLEKEAPRSDMRWKGWEAPADKWRNGLFGGHLTYALEFPCPVHSVSASARVSNFADGLADRRAFLEYSLDNRDWRPLAETAYGPGQQPFAGRAAIDGAGVNRVWVRVRQGARDDNALRGGSVVFQEFAFTVSGSETAPARMRESHAAAVGAAVRRQRAEQYIARARDRAAQAETLAGEARENAYAAAAEAYARTLEVCPDWQLAEAAGKGDWAHFFARQARADLWKSLHQHDRARAEYQAAFTAARGDNLDLRSRIQMMIGDVYAEEQNWLAAEEAYQRAQRIGLYGDMRHVLPAKLERVAPLAEKQREERTRADAARETRDLTLVVPDEPLHVPAADGLFRADLTQAGAAQRLRMLIERAAGVRPGLVPAAETPTTGRRIFVGYGPHLQSVVSPPEAPEGLKIIERDGDVYLLGEIAPAGTNNWPGAIDRGVMHAVETFAERVMGYRFVVSIPDNEELFELGTVVPALKTLEVEPGLRIEQAPVFRHRVGSGKGGHIGFRAGSAPAFNCNHSYHVEAWARMYAEQHPELFIPKVPEGAEEQDAAHVEAMGAQRHLNFLDYTEPLVLEKHLGHLQEFFETGRNPGPFYRVPTLTHIMEEPPDWPAPSFQYNARSRALFNPNAGQWGGFSQIWFDYLRRLALEVKERWPHMRISALAYYRHYDTPTFEIPDNIDVMVALMRTSMANKEPYVFDKNLAHVKKWSEYMKGDRSRLFLWEYGCWPSFWVTPPLTSPLAMQRWLQAVRPYVSGVFFEHYDVHEFYLMPRLWFRLLWDPELDVAAEIEDLCRHLYGPAGESMAAFYRRLIDRYEMQWDNPPMLWDQYYLAPELYYGQSYPPEEIRRLAASLEAARRQVGLPPLLEAEARHGTAVFLFNAADDEVPVGVVLAALEGELVAPSVGWDGGRLTWPGRLQPGERLEITGADRAKLTAWDGLVREVNLVRSGETPRLGAGQASVFHFWYGGVERDIRFRVALSYGPDTRPVPDKAERSIHARRLAWVRDPYLVFQPGGGSRQRGFLAEAHVAHRHLGRAPSYEAPAVHALPTAIDAPLWRDVPAAELLMGADPEAGTVPPELRFGFPADRRTRFQFVRAQEGLALRLEAEVAPADGERIELLLGGKTFAFAPGEEGNDGSFPRQIEVDERGWRGLAQVAWKELGLEWGHLPAELPLQLSRVRDDSAYVWSPPMGTFWAAHGKRQGPGRLLLGVPSADAATSRKQ
jgi:hypothetical protein